jgi:hypothetical protein
MKAVLLNAARHTVAENAFVEIRIWKLPRTLPGSTHELKYRLAYVVDDISVMRYDNEVGKGDHRHVGDVETAYHFTTMEALLDDFWNDVEQWSAK